MNPLNYCTLEAAKRLRDAGIEIKTDFYHRCYPARPNIHPAGFQLVTKEEMLFGKTGDDVGDGRDIDGVMYYPAPSLTNMVIDLMHRYHIHDAVVIVKLAKDVNAAIDLLIWLEGRKG
jgi:hypothetical protein